MLKQRFPARGNDGKSYEVCVYSGRRINMSDLDERSSVEGLPELRTSEGLVKGRYEIVPTGVVLESTDPRAFKGRWLVKIRNLKRKSCETMVSVWPPSWASSYGAGDKFAIGEEGTLRSVRRVGNHLTLTIDYDGREHLGALEWDEDAGSKRRDAQHRAARRRAPPSSAPSRSGSARTP